METTNWWNFYQFCQVISLYFRSINLKLGNPIEASTDFIAPKIFVPQLYVYIFLSPRILQPKKIDCGVNKMVTQERTTSTTTVQEIISKDSPKITSHSSEVRTPLLIWFAIDGWFCCIVSDQ